MKMIKLKLMCVFGGGVLFFLNGFLLKTIFGHVRWEIGGMFFVVFTVIVLTYKDKERQ